MLLLDSIHDQIPHRHTLLGEQRAISFRFTNTHRLRNRHERKTRLLWIVKHRPHGLNSLIQITQEDIDFIRNNPAPSKMTRGFLKNKDQRRGALVSTCASRSW